MYCPKCGKQNPDAAKFCESCGSSIYSFDVDEKKPQCIESPNKDNEAIIGHSNAINEFFKSKYNVFVVILTLALIVALVFTITKSFAKKQEQKPVSNIGLNSVASMDKRIFDEKQYLIAKDWREMKFMLNGVEYQLPLDISELESHGWTLEYEDTKVEVDKSVSFSAYNENSYIKGTLYNSGSSSTNSKNCKIRTIGFVWANAVLPSDIIVSSSDIDSAYDAYGDPDYYNEIEEFYIWGDKSEFNGNEKYLKLYFDDEKTLIYAEMGCDCN